MSQLPHVLHHGNNRWGDGAAHATVVEPRLQTIEILLSSSLVPPTSVGVAGRLAVAECSGRAGVCARCVMMYSRNLHWWWVVTAMESRSCGFSNPG